ncbi:MAG: DUF1700 domain-containing protein [Bacilli bacterium]|nr:DUF1700 domain-containing protein [Bacilli bacterium]
MTKEQFIKLLSKKLQVLDDEERESILKKYSGMIDKAVKKGKTEEEVVGEFDVEDIVYKVLSEHKINPNYNNTEYKAKDFVQNMDDKLSDFMSWLNKGFKKVKQNFNDEKGNFNTNFFFDLVVKVLLLLFLLIVLALPFKLFSLFGTGFFGLFFNPLNFILSFSWQILVGISYLLLSIYIVVKFLKYLFEKNEKINVSKVENKSDDKFTSVILKVVVSLLVLFPLWCLNFSLFIVLAVIIYLITKGIYLWGLLILIAGLSFLFGFVSDSIRRIVFYKQKVYFYPFFISAILLVVGSLMFAENMLGYNYSNNLVNSSLSKTVTYEQNITEKTFVNTNDYFKDIVIDNTLEDGVLLIKVEYYAIYDVVKIDSGNNIEIEVDFTDDKINAFDLFIDDVKNKELFNYSKVNNVIITLYINSNTRNLIS